MQTTPQITLWPVPDGSATYTLNLRMLHQIEDASIPNGTTLAIPYRWLDAYVAALAHRLSRIYAPDKEAIRKQDADTAWTKAALRDTEDVPFYIAPQTQSYWR